MGIVRDTALDSSRFSSTRVEVGKSVQTRIRAALDPDRFSSTTVEVGLETLTGVVSDAIASGARTTFQASVLARTMQEDKTDACEDNFIRSKCTTTAGSPSPAHQFEAARLQSGGPPRSPNPSLGHFLADSAFQSGSASRTCGLGPHRHVALPFEADFRLEFGTGVVDVCQHLCASHCQRTHNIVVFIPGVAGGVGPCRGPGLDFDKDALFEGVARRLVEAPDANVDCFRLSWPHAYPQFDVALESALCAVRMAITRLAFSESKDVRRVNVIFVGHSFGGSVAMQAAEATPFRITPMRFAGYDIVPNVAGVCALSTSIAKPLSASFCRNNPQCRVFLVAGDADEVVSPSNTTLLSKALPMTNKQILMLPGGVHDLYAFKTLLLRLVFDFVTETNEVLE